MVSKVLAALFLLPLLACAPQDDYVISVSSNADYDLVVAATKDWETCGVTHFRITRDVGGDTDAIIAHVPDDYDLGERRIAGLTENGAIVLYKSNHGAEVSQQTIIHELGHVQGLGHESGTVMQAIFQPTHPIWKVTPADCRALQNR